MGSETSAQIILSTPVFTEIHCCGLRWCWPVPRETCKAWTQWLVYGVSFLLEIAAANLPKRSECPSAIVTAGPAAHALQPTPCSACPSSGNTMDGLCRVLRHTADAGSQLLKTARKKCAVKIQVSAFDSRTKSLYLWNFIHNVRTCPAQRPALPSPCLAVMESFPAAIPVPSGEKQSLVLSPGASESLTE